MDPLATPTKGRLQILAALSVDRLMVVEVELLTLVEESQLTCPRHAIVPTALHFNILSCYRGLKCP